jgi:hypothetical protein
MGAHLVDRLGSLEAADMRLTIPERKLTNPKRFVIEVGTDGFNAYAQREDHWFELFAASVKAVQTDFGLFAASSTMSTFIKVMETICNSNGQNKAHFVLEETK